MIEQEDIEQIGFYSRASYAIRAFMHIIMNRPIICYFDDSTIYARTNPFYMKAASEALSEVADAQIAEELTQSIKNLMDIPDYRQN